MDESIVHSPVATAALLQSGEERQSSTGSSASTMEHLTRGSGTVGSSQESIATPLQSVGSGPPPTTQSPMRQDMDYELDVAIGFGSSAIVHAGRQVSTGQPVAIKVFDLDRFEQSQIDRLHQELAVMALCRNEHLLSNNVCLTRGNELWLVMPLCAAGSIADVLRWAFPEGLEEPVIAAILHQAVSGLAALHGAGHCHRDVKAANLLLDCDGTVRLADFGVSAVIGEEQIPQDGKNRPMFSALSKRRKTFVGTPCWMAPEVMEGTGYDGAAADIWSMGIVALELAYGQAPFARYPPMKVIYLTLSAASPPSLEKERCRHRYSKTFKDFIDVCLQRDPGKRPTADVLLKHPFLRGGAKKQQLLVERLVAHCPPISARNISGAMAREPPKNHTSSNSNINDHNHDGNPSDNGRSAPEKTIEWDFDEADNAAPHHHCNDPSTDHHGQFQGHGEERDPALSSSVPLLPAQEANPGTISRRGRFIVHQHQQQVLDDAGPSDSESVTSGLRDLLLTVSQSHSQSNVQSSQPNGSYSIRKGRFSIECRQQEPSQAASGCCCDRPAFPQNAVCVPASQWEQLLLLVDMLKQHLDSMHITLSMAAPSEAAGSAGSMALPGNPSGGVSAASTSHPAAVSMSSAKPYFNTSSSHCNSHCHHQHHLPHCHLAHNHGLAHVPGGHRRSSTSLGGGSRRNTGPADEAIGADNETNSDVGVSIRRYQ